MGHMGPLSSFPLSLKPNIAYRSLNFVALRKKRRPCRRDSELIGRVLQRRATLVRPRGSGALSSGARTLAQARSRLRCPAPGFRGDRDDQTSGTPLVSPPVALASDVFARILAEVGRADDEDLEALWPGLVASPRAGRDAHRVPFFELDDLVVDLHPPAPAQHHVHLLLRQERVAVRTALAGRDALVAQRGL